MKYNLPLFQPDNPADLFFYKIIDQQQGFPDHLYSRQLADLRRFIAAECDKIDYKGSMLYDELHDKILFIKYCKELTEVALLTTTYGKTCDNTDHLFDIVRVLVANEFYNRRKHKYYGNSSSSRFQD